MAKSKSAVAAAKSAAAAQAAEKLEQQHSAMCLHFRWPSLQRTFDASQKLQTAQSFEASERGISASKKLFDTSNPLFRKVTSIKGQMENYWEWNSLPYPADAVRLFRRDDVEKVVAKMTGLREEFYAAVQALNERYEDIRNAAKDRLGQLFNPADYPASLLGAFEVSWEFRNVNPPEYLMKLNPALYEHERRNMQAKFDEAVKMAETAFTQELAKMVDHLAQKLAGRDEDGKRAIFRDSAIVNMHDFFDKFKHLNVRSNPQLDRLVEEAKSLVAGIDPDTIRHDYALRDQLAVQMEGVKGQLDGMLTAQPRRKINRAAMPNGAAV